jgi:hypothetical protein
MRAIILALIVLSAPAHAVLYSYTNADGEYVVSQTRPVDKNTQYAVLTDEGEFIRLVRGNNQRLPVTHWRPWFIPKEPHPWDGPADSPSEREPVVTVDEESGEQ